MRKIFALFVTVLFLGVAASSNGGNWDGDAPYNGGVTYFDWSGGLNFYGNTYPTWNSSTPLYFSYNNSGHVTLNQNIGYKPVQSLIYESTFIGSTTLQGSDGFDLYWKVENFSSGTQTVNVPLVVQGTSFELNPINGNLTVGGGINNFNNRDLNVYGNNGKTLTLNTTFSGTGAQLILNQNSIVLLNSQQTYTGQTWVKAGTLRLGASDSISDSSNLYLTGGTFDLNGFSEDVANLVNGSSGNITITGVGQQFRVNQTTTSTYSGIMSGTGGFVKKGTALLTLSGANSYSGNTFIDNGELRYNTNQDGGYTGTINLGATSGTAGAAVGIGTGGVDISNNINVRSGSSGTKSIVAQNSSGVATFSGNVTLNAGLTTQANNGSGSLVLSGSINTSGTGNQTITVTGGNNTTFSGVVSGGGKIVKQDGGQLTLSNTGNTYTGNTEIDQGTLLVSGDINDSSVVYIGNGTINQDATLALAGAGASFGTVQVNPTAGGAGNRTISATAGSHSMSTLQLQRDVALSIAGSSSLSIGALNLSLSGNNDISISGSGDVTITGAITAATGASEINKSGTGQTTISGNNTGSNYKLNINQGTVVLNNANALGNTAGFVGKVNFASNTGTLQVSQNIATGAGVTMTVASGITGIFDVDSTKTFTVNGTISGSGGNIRKEGDGTMVLGTGVNSYSGSTIVNAGTLVVNGSIASSSSISVSAGAYLSGNGTIGVLGGSGIVSPGNSPGIMTASQFDPTGGLDAGFEFTGTGDPIWNNASASKNDVLRLTNTTTPFASDLDSSNVLKIYFDVATLTLGDTFRGGFYTDKNTDFTASVDLATYQYYVRGDGGGAFTFNGVNYYTLSQYYPTLGVTRDVVSAPADFGGGTINGWVQQFQINDTPLAVPEPSSIFLFVVGVGLLYRRWRNRR